MVYILNQYKIRNRVIPGLPVWPVLMRMKGGDNMPKIIIGFQTGTEFKKRVVKAGKNYKIQGISNPVNLSMFCRIAVAKLVSEVEEKGE